MYVFPVQFPQVSNREDLLLTVSLFDDDTGDPVKMDGTATASPQAFTGSNWTVTDGAIVTTSTTTITIPAYPIGNQLSALALIVGLGLGILPGDPITIADPTGLNTMTGYVTSYAPTTGAIVVQIGLTFQFEIREVSPRDFNNGYVSFWNLGTPNEYGPILSASLGNGITFVDIGVIQIMIPEVTFRRLKTGTYQAALTATDSVNTRQMFVGNLPVQWGGVTQ